MRGLAWLWVTAALLATAWMGAAGTQVGTWPEGYHLLGHLVLCGGAAFLAGRSRDTVLGVVVGVGLGAAIEIVQLPNGQSWIEASYDLGVDVVAALLGALMADRGERSGHLASAVLHPLLIAPVGLAAAVYVVARDAWEAIGWTLVAAACLGPAVGLWVVGTTGGWWSDADVSRRAERGPLFAAGVVCAVGFLLVAHRAPAPVPHLALVAAGCAALGALLTRLGLKVSGHVAIPAALGLLVAPSRIAVPLLAAALLLSWARVAARRHRPVEIVAAWLVAAAGAIP
ncbi:MAG: hypothetical protein KC621_07185 [Myxococcales bacterium]|nr:hypothetical protein [Myxococcales bacterium]